MLKPVFPPKGVLDPVELLDAGHRSANLLAAGTTLLSRAVGDIVAKQVDFLRVENDEITQCAAALARGEDPVGSMQRLAAAVQVGTDGALADFRQIQDRMRACAWGLVGLYVDALSLSAGFGRPTPLADEPDQSPDQTRAA